MKKRFFILTLFISFFLSRGIAHGQLLSLDSIANFPDTINANDTVAVMLFISNSGGVNFTGDLTIFIHAMGDSTGADTLYFNPSYVLSGNTVTDSIPIEHVFRAADFDGGDNIVVVWPSSSQLPVAVPGDSLTFMLHVKNFGIEEESRQQAVQLYPNPAREQIRLRIAHPEKVEQVRIYDVLGNSLMDFQEAVYAFSVESLACGVYFVEVRNKDRSRVVKKFLRE